MEAYLKALCMNWSVISSIRRASMLPSPPSQGNILIQLQRHSLPGGGGGGGGARGGVGGGGGGGGGTPGNSWQECVAPFFKS